MNREKILKYGIEVFNGEVDKFSNWLLKSNHAIGGKTPNELLENEDGKKQIYNLLSRIDYGNFS